MSTSTLLREKIKCEYGSVSRHRVSPRTVMDVTLTLHRSEHSDEIGEEIRGSWLPSSRPWGLVSSSPHRFREISGGACCSRFYKIDRLQQAEQPAVGPPGDSEVHTSIWRLSGACRPETSSRYGSLVDCTCLRFRSVFCS